jgi:hypothetical protein
MPEAIVEPAQSPQSEPIASTPQPTADQPTTVETSEKGLLDYLDIPQEVRAQLEPKPVEPEEPVTTPDEVHPEIPIPEEEESQEEEEAEPPVAEQAPPHKIDKRQKRINRLTRQKSELQEQLDAKDQRERALLEKLAQYEGKAQPQPTVPTTTSPRLAHITDERTLNREIVQAQTAIDWYDNHSDGVTVVGQNGQEEYWPPDKIDQERKRAEKVLLEAPNRRLEIRDFNLVRARVEIQTRENFPKLFDQSSEDFQMAAELRQLYPVLNTMPNGDYAVGLLIEGAKSLQAQQQSKNGQPTNAHRDIDERVFTTPRVPIAPHTPGPPTRESTPSSQKIVNEAMSRLISDPDGSPDALADVFRAREEASRRQPGSRSEVKV